MLRFLSTDSLSGMVESTFPNFIFDEGIFQWQPDELMTKAIAFTSMMEKMLGAEEGSFDYIIGKFGRPLENGNPNEKGAESNE